MELFFGLLSFTLFIALIVGLINPSLVLRWIDKPTRLKVLGYWFLSSIIIGFTSTIFIDEDTNTEKNNEINNDHTVKNDFTKGDSLNIDAQPRSKKADSLSIIRDNEKRIAEKTKAKQTKIDQLKREIKSIDEGINLSDKNTVEELQMSIVIFASWANLIENSEKSDDNEIIILSKKLKSKVAKVQSKEFPNLRKKYAKIVADKMWENDIEVSTNGTGKKYINFSGAIFAANKNKKDFQTQVHEILTMFRFKQSRYRWYKGESEYTYYSIYEGNDSTPVTFEK